MDVFQRLHECIRNHTTAVLVTVTEVIGDYPDFLGVKLLYTDDAYWSTKPTLNKPLKNLLHETARQALYEKTSGTFTRALFLDGSERIVELEVYAEVYLKPTRLIVAGAGHVAKPVVHLGKMTGMNVTVICDRSQHATKAAFPEADDVICQDYIAYFKDLPVDQDTYILLLTRGHQFDVMILRELLGRPMGYVGMIGSKRRISGVFSQLATTFPEESFRHVYAPVGLDIGAQTPEEIAVSIIAEILKKKNGGSGRSLSEKITYFIRRQEQHD